MTEPQQGAGFSTRQPSSIPLRESPFAAGGSWGRGVCRSRDTRDSDSTPFLDDRSSPLPRKWSRNCTEPETSADGRFSYDPFSRLYAAASRLFDCSERAFLPLVRLQHFLAQAQRCRSDFDELVVGYELNGLFQIQGLERH